MTEQEYTEGREKAMRYYRILTLLLGILGAGMLALGIVATINQDEDAFGPPYFIGGYLVGIMSLFAALVCGCVVMKAPGATTDLKRKELGCAIQGQYILSMLMIMACLVGTMMAGVGGLSSFDEDQSEINKNLAIVILVGCIGGLCLTVGSMCVVCTYGQYFGVIMVRGRRGRAVMINANGSNMVGATNNSIFQTNNSQISQLERQNQLLQQQIALQQQLAQQQQQQQQQGFGFSQPPPPPSYSSAVYPPAY